MAGIIYRSPMPIFKKPKVEVNRLEPLVSAKVVSEVQLRTAKANYAAAVAAASQARASVGGAKINVGFTTITAPVSGYIGRIPYKKGSYFKNRRQSIDNVIRHQAKLYAYILFKRT
ncbi:hypothetical protein [Chryseobacterium indoltheticum]|uniref:hypothetical protein n=1 Tax=Chryseobacterium indoltheticum TaxID=254 RepID=UPI003F49516B